MQLKIKRSQRTGGMLGGKVFFALDIRAEYSAEEKANINKYSLGGEVIYNSEAAKRHLDAAGGSLADGSGRGVLGAAASLALAKLNLNVTIASLAQGQHIECKDLGELLSAENALRDACKNLKEFLAVAATFDGSEVVIDFNDPKLAAA